MREERGVRSLRPGSTLPASTPVRVPSAGVTGGGVVMAVGRSARMRACGAAVVVIAVALTAACSGEANWQQPGGASPGGASGQSGSPAPGVSTLTVKPIADAKNVSPVSDI